METKQLTDTTFARAENWQISWDLAESPRKITLATKYERYQNPIPVLHLALKTSIFLSAVSFRLSPLSFIRVSFDDSESLSRPVVLIFFVAVSVTWVFCGTGLLAAVPNPLTWRTGGSCFVGPLPFDLFGFGGPTRRLSSRRHNSWGVRGTQARQPRQGGDPSGD